MQANKKRNYEHLYIQKRVRHKVHKNKKKTIHRKSKYNKRGDVDDGRL